MKKRNRRYERNMRATTKYLQRKGVKYVAQSFGAKRR